MRLVSGWDSAVIAGQNSNILNGSLKSNSSAHLHVVLDADALWFLAEHPEALKQDSYATPHPGEAAKLLHCSVKEVESDGLQQFINYRKNMPDNGC